MENFLQRVLTGSWKLKSSFVAIFERKVIENAMDEQVMLKKVS
jgi:hypothetical protein